MKLNTLALSPLLIGAPGLPGIPAFAQLDPATFQNPPPGERHTFTTLNFYATGRELSPSGLIGPVRLFQESVTPLN